MIKKLRKLLDGRFARRNCQRMYRWMTNEYIELNNQKIYQRYSEHKDFRMLFGLNKPGDGWASRRCRIDPDWIRVSGDKDFLF
jgi:hypothetical protein